MHKASINEGIDVQARMCVRCISMKAKARINDSKVRSIRARKTRNLADSNKLNGVNESFLEIIKSIKSEVVDFYWLML